MQAAPAAVSQQWRTAGSVVPLGRPVIVGILNVTPDSFWDGGIHSTVNAAVRHASRLLQHGADILDIGGESTRPGAAPVYPDDEVRRVMPVLEAVRREWPQVPVSIDTVKAEVARAALEAGASIINDVSGLRLDRDLAGIIAHAGAGVILMHSRGAVDNMARYELAEYGPDPVGDVVRELDEAVTRAHMAGIADECIVLDPGLGFSKRTEHSLAVLRQLERIAARGHPVLVGPSRKRFIGEAAGAALPPDARLEGTIAACVIALLNGARLFRVHDVAPVRRALDFADVAHRSAAL